MKIFYNNLLPFHGFLAINLFGILFVRKEYRKAVEGTRKFDIMVNHESIHTAQMKEMGYIFFYLWYLLEFIFRFLCIWNFKGAYREISFEKEAYRWEEDFEYLGKRKRYSWWGDL